MLGFTCCVVFLGFVLSDICEFFVLILFPNVFLLLCPSSVVPFLGERRSEDGNISFMAFYTLV